MKKGISDLKDVGRVPSYVIKNGEIHPPATSQAKTPSVLEACLCKTVKHGSTTDCYDKEWDLGIEEEKPDEHWAGRLVAGCHDVAHTPSEHRGKETSLTRAVYLMSQLEVAECS